MVNVKRTKRRLFPGSAIEWFKKNLKIWHELMDDKTVEIPEEVFTTIQQNYGEDMCEEVKTKKVIKDKLPVRKEGESNG